MLDAGKSFPAMTATSGCWSTPRRGCATTEVQGVLDDWMHILRPRLRMLELVRRLKNHGLRVLPEQHSQDVLELLTERGVLAQFDGGVASCEVQVNKPDPQIYKALLKKYQLKASEVRIYR